MRRTIHKLSIPVTLTIAATLLIFNQQKEAARAQTIAIAKDLDSQLSQGARSYRSAIAASERLGHAGFTAYCEILNEGREAERVRSRDALLDQARDVLTTLHDNPSVPWSAQEQQVDHTAQIRTVTLLTHLCMLNAERLCTASEAEQAIQPILDALQLGRGFLQSPDSRTSWLGTSVIDQVCKRSLIQGEKMARPLVELLSTTQRVALERSMQRMAKSSDISSLEPFRALQKIVKTIDQGSGDAFATLEFAKLCQQFYAWDASQMLPRTAVIHHFNGSDNRYAIDLTRELRNATTPAWRISFDRALAVVTSASTETAAAAPPAGR